MFNFTYFYMVKQWKVKNIHEIDLLRLEHFYMK